MPHLRVSVRALRAFGLCVLIVLAACSGARDAQGSGSGDRRRALADSVVRAGMRERELPGLAVVVLRQDDTLLATGHGVTRVGGTEAITPSTVFQLGSIGKQFLAALVVALVEEGKIDLDAPVTRYLERFPLLGDSIRVRHLLEQTSGIRELFMLPEAAAAFDDLTSTRAELVAAVRRAPVDFAPGSRWSYSNTNYTLLALIVERITGTPYEDALAERLFRPLGLASMRACSSIPADTGEAHGHERRGDSTILSAPENMEWIRGDGGLCGSAHDVARWTRLLAAGRVVGADRYARMVTAARTADGSAVDYGFALSLASPDGAAKVAHNGMMRGSSASAAYYPDSAFTVVVLVNRGDVRTEAIERRVARSLLGIPEPARTPVVLDSAERQRLVGRYDIGPFDARILARGDTLWLEVPRPGPTTQLVPLGGGHLVSSTEPDAYAVHVEPGTGPAPRLRLYMAAMHWYGVRRP